MIQRLTNQGFRFYQSMFSEKTHLGGLAKRAPMLRSRCYLENPNGQNLEFMC